MSVEKYKKMYIVDTTCWKCSKQMKAVMIKSSDSFYGPENFSENELYFARENGARIEQHFSFTRKEAYLANTCSNCKTFIGEHYLFTDYFVAAMNGDCDFEVYDIV